ncbi:MAG: ATP-binding protein [Cyanobacteria bacterium P01_H01_bin.15]
MALSFFPESETASSRLRHSPVREVIAYLRQLCEDASKINRVNSAAMSRGELSPHNLEQLQARFWQQYQLFDHIDSIQFANESGQYIGIIRRHDGTTSLEILRELGQERQTVALDDWGEPRGPLLSKSQDDDPRALPRSFPIKLQPNIRWSSVYQYSGAAEIQLGITALKSVYQSTPHQLLGVFACDIALGQLQTYLQLLPISPSETIVIWDRQGNCIGGSGEYPPIEINKHEVHRLSIANYPVPEVRGAWEHLQPNWEQASGLQPYRQFEFVQNSQRYSGDLILLSSIIPQLDWYLLLVQPAVNLFPEGLAEPNSYYQNLEKNNQHLNQILELRTQHLTRLSRELSKSQERWQLAIQGTHDGIWDWDLQTDQIFRSWRWYEITGFSNPTIAQTLDDFFQLVHPEDISIIQKTLRAHLAKETPYFAVEYRLKDEQDQFKWMLDRGQMLWNQAGCPIRMVGSTTDISQTKAIERSLREQTDSLDSFSRNLKYLHSIVTANYGDRGSLFSACLAAGCEMLGLEHGVITKQLNSHWLVSEAAHPQGNTYAPNTRIFIQHSPCQLVLQNQKTTVSIRGSEINPDWQDLVYVGTCLHQGEQTYGTIYFLSRCTTRTHFARHELEIVELMAQSISAFLTSEQAKQEREQLAVALHQTEILYQTVVEAQTDLICRYFPSGVLTFINEMLSHFFEHPAWEMVGQSFFSYFSDPTSREMIETHIQEITAKESIRTVEVEMTAGSGQSYFIQWNTRGIFDEQGRLVEYQSVGRDISDRKQAEAALKASREKYQILFESLPIGVGITDDQGYIIEANNALSDIWQLDGLATEYNMLEASSSLGQVNIRKSDGSKFSQQDCPICQTILKGTAFNNAEILVERAGENPRWFSVTAAPISLPSFGAVFAYVDITERKQAERLQQEFIAITGHELRSPLTSIRGSLGLIQTGRLGALNEQGKQLLDLALLDAQRMTRLISDMLNYQGLRSGRYTLQRRQCNLVQLFEQAVETAQSHDRMRNVRIDCLNSDIVAWVDGERLVQVLINLLDNAFKFSHDKTTVIIEASETVSQILICVKDQGQGIPASHLNTIFDPFRQVSPANSRNHQGVGLGLAICRDIINAHSGRIWAESEVGIGSTFWIHLPKGEVLSTDIPILT